MAMLNNQRVNIQWDNIYMEYLYGISIWIISIWIISIYIWISFLNFLKGISKFYMGIIGYSRIII